MTENKLVLIATVLLVFAVCGGVTVGSLYSNRGVASCKQELAKTARPASEIKLLCEKLK